jgi:serine/threonine protein kinase/tetratricopeptide (TPR) repeat protein
MPADPKRLQSIFLAAEEADDRAAVLDRECGGDAELRRQVEKLLAAHDDSAELPAANGATGDYASVAIEKLAPGSVFAGRYKLRELLGEGGMGVVYVADQLEPVQRRVALKIIRANLPTQTLMARFEQERQALALMDHPNIAKVYDAGVAESPTVATVGLSGTPYFVMELIKGLPITKYCDDAKLSPRQRLELFIPVCQAVQHAHQKGIIHRDLKPANIIVGLYDGRPVPKVIDFGVAKITGPRLTEHSVYTEVGSIIGTLEYISPEQAELNNLDIDTRTDIYALGVILYELLTGTVPFSRKEMQSAGFVEMLRVIKEQEPSKPSTKLSGSGSLPSLAACRHTEPAKLTRLVRGELDWITMKALEKDRSRRYETANGMAMDIRRYLDDEPVLASPPSAAYRMKKFVRRNRPQVIAASFVFLALIAGVIGTSLGRLEAQRQEGLARDEANAKEQARQAEAEERKKAEAKEAEANAVVKFFEEQVFAAARPKGQAGGLGAAVTLRNAIAASVPALEKSFTAQPLVEARLRLALGNTFWYLAEHEQARSQSERARGLYTRHKGPDHPDTLTSMMNLANCYAALNRLAEALKLHEEVLEIRKRVLPKDHPDTLRSMMNLANCYAALNHPAEALKLREEVLEIQKRVLPRDYPDTLKSMSGLAISYATLNRPAEAMKLREEVLEIQKRVLPKDHPDTLASMNNLAISYTALNRHAEALTLREEVLEIQKRVLPKDHPDTLMGMHNLAISYAKLNRPAEALTLREEVLEIRKRVLPKDHPDTLRSMTNLAISYAALNRHAEALTLREEVLEIQKRVLPKDHPDMLKGMNNLAVSYAALNRHAEALKLFEETLAARKRVLPAADPAIGATIYGIACVHALMIPKADDKTKQADVAMGWLKQAVAAGNKNVEHMKKDKDLDALRDREDFRKLIAELEKSAGKKP